MSTITRTRTIPPVNGPMTPEHERRIKELLSNPYAVQRELNNRSLYQFLQYFWPLVSAHDFSHNWHIEYLCGELEAMAYLVAERKPKDHDLIINVPPGTTKTITCSIMFPAWCWSKWFSMRFITSSYSATLSLESAEYCRDLIRSTLFKELYPELDIKSDKDTKSNFKIVKKLFDRNNREIPGGNRYSTSVGGTLTGFHGDILIVDDPLNPNQAASDTELKNANHWVEQTLSTRKTDKVVTPTVIVMQRLHQDDPSGHWLAKNKSNTRHISLPGECVNYAKQVKPPELIRNYKDGLLDPKRLSWAALRDLEADLGQYGYAGQIGQDPTPPGGGMFKVDHFQTLETMPPANHIAKTVRYWDKAATVNAGAYSCGTKICRLTDGRWVVLDVKRGRWSSHEREKIIRETAAADGYDVDIWMEQEPGSGGKESAEGTVRNLAGFKAYYETSTGDKANRADPYSVQVNVGAFSILRAHWNHDYIEEHRFFPYSTYKDQVDSSAGAFNKLIAKRVVRSLGRNR